MILIADSGSTKTDWVLHDGEAIVLRINTQGLNPTQQSAEDIYKVISEELDGKIAPDAPKTIYFYGAGCAYETADNRMKKALEQYFDTRDIHIHSDLLAAARAMCGHETGIACILGTGSNSCLFDGEKIIGNTPSLGYILGDEGSGSYLGRRLLSDCLKKQLPRELCTKFMNRYNLDMATILERVYQMPLPNRWLASFTPFLVEHKEIPEIKSMLKQCFTDFFKRNTMVYRRSWLPIHIIGGVGVNFENEIKETAESLGFSIGKVAESPIDGLIEYHKTN